MAPAADDVALCGDDELDYLANQTQFELGQGFLLDQAYCLAHLPLVAPHHPRVIARHEGRPYEMGRHEPVFSLVLPIADALLRRSAAYLALEAELKASPLAPKIAWNVVERRRHKLHATLCGSLATGETPPVLDAAQGDALKRLGPVTVARRWDRSIVTFQAEALWLLGASDDLVLGPEMAERVPLI
jgi:hypothetical protein